MLALPGRDARLDPDAALFVEGAAAGDIHEVVSGVVRLSRMLPDDRREVLGFVFPGELFSASGFGLAEPQAATCTAEAVTAARVVAYPWNRLDDLLAARPDVAGRMLAAVRRDLFRAQQQMLLLGRMSALERLVWFLLLMARLQDTAPDVPLYLPMSRDDVADYLGITAEAVSRVFFHLRKTRLVALEDASTVRIMDWRSLRLLAEGVRPSRGWWLRQVAEALRDLGAPEERQAFAGHMVRCDGHALQALAQTGAVSPDRLRQILMQALAKLRQRATDRPER